MTNCKNNRAKLLCYRSLLREYHKLGHDRQMGPGQKLHRTKQEPKRLSRPISLRGGQVRAVIVLEQNRLSGNDIGYLKKKSI